MATSTLRRLFPRWMAIRDDPASVGGKLLDFLGERILGEGLQQTPPDFWEIALENIRPLVEDALPTTARPDQASWLFVAPVDLPPYAPQESRVLISWAPSVQAEARFVDILVELALGDADVPLAYLDAERSRLFLRPPLTYDPANVMNYLQGAVVEWGTLRIAGSKFAPHLLWNAFDELALRLGKRRLLWESNESLLRRCLYTLRFPPDGSPERLACLAAIECGLIAELPWRATVEQTALNLAHPSARPSTVYLCPVPEDSAEAWARAWMSGLPAHPSQVRVVSEGAWQVVAELELLSDPADWWLRGVHFGVLSLPSAAVPGVGSYPADGLELDEGAVEGTAVLPVLRIGNLRAWNVPDLHVWDTQGLIRVEVAPAHYRSPIGWRLPASAAIPGAVADLVDFPDASPLALRITLRRDSPQAPSPKITRLRWAYRPADCVVSYLWGTSVHSLSDPALRSVFYTAEGHPTPILRDILSQVARQAPILWDQMRWDEHYWDVVKVGQGLASVPALWDPSAGASLRSDRSLWQAGIGDLEDLRVSLQTSGLSASFSPYVAGGYAFLFPSATASTPEPVYRFVRPQTLSIGIATGYSSINLDPPPSPGTPLAVRLQGNPAPSPYFRPAAFLDAQGDLTLLFLGEAVSDGTYLVLPHDGIDPLSVVLPSEMQVNTNAYDGSHRLPIQQGLPPAGTTVPIRYYLDRSYLYDGRQLHVYSSVSGTLDVTYETAEAGQADIVEDLSLSPLTRPRPAGFIYHTAFEPQVARLEVGVSPDELLANGVDWAYIEVRTLDSYGNPVFGQTVSGSASQGTLTGPTRYGERHIFYYTSPSLNQVPSTVTLTFSVGTVSAAAQVVLR